MEGLIINSLPDYARFVGIMLRYVCEELCGWGAIAPGRGEYFLSNYRCVSDRYRFKGKRDIIKSNNRPASRELMIANKTNGAVVIVGGVVVVMGRRNKRGQQENQYKESRKAFVPVHCVPFTHKHTICSNDAFVKKLFEHQETLSLL